MGPNSPGWIAVLIWMSLSAAVPTIAGEEQFLEPLRPTLRELHSTIGLVPAERQQVLEACAQRIADALEATGTVSLKFICTHNSRRSHLSQVWGEVAAVYYEVPGILTSSGGTAVTACNPRTVQSLRRSGFSVVQLDWRENPVYALQYGELLPVARLQSKLHDGPGQPSQGFIAMLCCSDADESCPIIEGSIARVPLHYTDPKTADGTSHEAASYDQCSRVIGTEMFFLMSRVAAMTQERPVPQTESERPRTTDDAQ